jgi:uncharacterized repeat protein (TIGR03803 family)
VIRDSAGNLYGTTLYGGGSAVGTVFGVNKAGREFFRYSFSGRADGAYPFGRLILDAKGNLYGTTSAGGTTGTCNGAGCGVVFKLDKRGKETVLYSFTGGKDGANPECSLILDSQGNLYGTTVAGGTSGTCNGAGCGVVFKLNKKGKETALYSFTGGTDGALPAAGLVRDTDGHLYGTTIVGGGSGACIKGYSGCGTVFEVDMAGNETVLHSFTGSNGDGSLPYAPVIRDKAGNLYGTTTFGGSAGACGGRTGCGTVFRLDAAGDETIVYTFTGGQDGGNPSGGLLREASGDLYGTTPNGGPFDYGTVFKVDANGTETVLYSWSNPSLGANPYATLIRDVKGNLYGTTLFGGDESCGFGGGCGVVFELTP